MNNPEPMNSKTLSDLNIRTELKPGDIGYIVHMHGRIYGEEYGYGIEFEAYVAEGLAEFYRRYDPEKDRVWIVESYDDRIVGFMLLMNRLLPEGDAAQLRYFILEREFRGAGLGGMLMRHFMDALDEIGYRSAYLWTADGLDASAHLYTKYGFVLTEEKMTKNFGVAATEQRYDLVVK